MNHGRVLALALFALFSGIAQAKDFPAVPGEYVVKLKSTTSIMSVGSLERTLGATIKRTVSTDLGLVLVQRPIVETAVSAVNTLAHNPMVEYAEPNYIYRVSAGATATPSDPEYGKLWGMANTGQSITGDGGTFTGTPGVDIDAARAWQIETGSKQVIVAVIDTGVNFNEPDLADNIWTNDAELNGKAGVDDDANGFVDDIHGYDFVTKTGSPMDVFGHGTHCSGTIGAKANDGVGVVGVAWNVRIMPVRFLDNDGGGSLADAVSSIEYATKMKANIM
ncbi:MAG: S8 family serine peptidase, partial [Bdellovibrionales bacterium]